MPEITEEIYQRAQQLWPDAVGYITSTFNDIRPWHELSALIASAPDSPKHPHFLIYKDTVTVALTKIGALHLIEAEDKDQFVVELFRSILAYKDQL